MTWWLLVSRTTEKWGRKRGALHGVQHGNQSWLVDQSNNQPCRNLRRSKAGRGVARDLGGRRVSCVEKPTRRTQQDWCEYWYPVRTRTMRGGGRACRALHGVECGTAVLTCVENFLTIIPEGREASVAEEFVIHMSFCEHRRLMASNTYVKRSDSGGGCVLGGQRAFLAKAPKKWTKPACCEAWCPVKTNNACGRPRTWSAARLQACCGGLDWRCNPPENQPLGKRQYLAKEYVPWPSSRELCHSVPQGIALNCSPVGAGGAGATRSRWPGDRSTVYWAPTNSPKLRRLRPARDGRTPGIPNNKNPPVSKLWGKFKGLRSKYIIEILFDKLRIRDSIDEPHFPAKIKLLSSQIKINTLFQNNNEILIKVFDKNIYKAIRIALEI